MPAANCERHARWPEPEGLGQRTLGRVDLSHRIDRAPPFVDLLVRVTDVDNLCVTLQGKRREHDPVAILRLVEQNEVCCDTRLCLSPDFQINVRCNSPQNPVQCGKS